MADIYPSYIAAKGMPYDPLTGRPENTLYPSANAVAPRPAQPEPKPFNLQFAPPPSVPNLPPLDISVAGQRAPAALQPRAPAALAAANGNPKGIPANAIPVIRGSELSYDIPGTGQRFYPTVDGRVSEFSPSERLELARYTEPAQIGADASVRGASIRAGADVQQARIGAESNRFNTLTTLGATPRPFGSEQNPESPFAPALPTYGVPRINPVSGAVEGFTPIGAAAQRATQPREGATGTIGGRQFVVKNGQRVWTDGKP